MNKTNKYVILLLLLLQSPVEARSFSASATYYGNSFVGRRMANGKTYHHGGSFIAHPSLRLGKSVKICHKGKCVRATVTDRCRCSIDLSKDLFRQLAPLKKGRISVKVYH